MEATQLIQQGLTLLKSNLEAYSSFNPTEPYEAKNAYFLEIVRRSAPLFSDEGMVPFAEQYYRTMMDTIHDYEKLSGKRFNKGMVYANLGVILTAHGNLDEGIHYLLLADKEDEPFRRGPHGLLDHVLWEPFEDPHVILPLVELNTNAWAGLHFAVDKAFILDFLRPLALSDRLLLEATIWTLLRNLELNRNFSNDYTRGRLFSGIKDLCLLTEMLLRKKQGVIGQTLGPLLNNALNGHSIGYTSNRALVTANSLTEFLNNLEAVLHGPLTPELRRIYCLYLVRNFTGHHFDVSSHILSASGNEFFALYEETLTNILSVILFLAYEKLI